MWRERSLSFEQSEAYSEEAGQFIAGAVNSNVRLGSVPIPLCFERGEGPYLHDVDGNRFIDYALGMGPAILGHAPKPVCDAVAESLSKGQLFGGQHPAELQLARRMRELIPSAELVRVGLTGSEVVQAAIRLARAVTGRRKFIKFEGQYHGWFDSVLINNDPGVLPEPGAIPRAVHLESRGQSASVAGDVVVLPWNDLAAVEAILDAEGDDIAAILTEPAMCNAGAIMPRPGYLEGLRAATDRHGIILIFDEVITGFRLSPGSAQERFGVTPDLSTFAKAMAAGFPVSALAGKRELMEQFSKGVNHSGTYNSNVQGIVAALATINILRENGGEPLRKLDDNGRWLMERFRAVASDIDPRLQVQGFGACFNVFFADADHEVVDYQSYKRTDLARQRRLLNELAIRGVRPTSRGTWFLSTAHEQADLDETVDAFKASLKTISD